MRVVAILQARMNSTRLPGKVMLPLAGKPMVQNIVERVKRAKRLDDVVVAYPGSKDNEMSIGRIARECSVWPFWYEGDESDLIGRYLSAAVGFQADLIVRVPCDNPCVDPAYIDRAVEDYLDQPYVFFSNTTALIKHDGRPVWVDGLGAEVLSMSRLKWLDRITQGQPELREHPHKYFLDRYQDNSLPDEAVAFGKLEGDLRLDVNTIDDYKFIERIYNHFGHNHFTAHDILNCPPVQERLHGR